MTLPTPLSRASSMFLMPVRLRSPSNGGMTFTTMTQVFSSLAICKPVSRTFLLPFKAISTFLNPFILSPHCEYRTWSVYNDILDDTADERLVETDPSVSAPDDEIVLELASGLDDTFRFVPVGHLGLDRNTHLGREACCLRQHFAGIQCNIFLDDAGRDEFHHLLIPRDNIECGNFRTLYLSQFTGPAEGLFADGRPVIRKQNRAVWSFAISRFLDY